ncbi:MAG: glycine cleavage T C-terminal barrel domain-containing protein, partial [Trebonia sp.]
ELMSGRVTTVDVHEADVARFYPSSRTTGFTRARAAESFNKMYGIVHPAEQSESLRPLRTGPLYERAKELGAVCHETARWERPHWYASNEPLLDRYAGKLMDRPAEWDSRWWSPIINAEHLAMREAAGLVDLSAFTILDVTGPGALAGLQNLAVAQLDVPVGRTVYTPFLNEAGRFVADLTIMRLGASSFRVVTGAADGGRDAKWIADRLPDDATLADVSSGWATIGLWGPRAGDILAAVNRDGDQSPPKSFGMNGFFELGGALVLGSRISYVGEFGWELHVPAEQAGQLWDLLCRAGQPHDLVPVGIGVYGTTGRLEKGYRAFGAELTLEYDPVEAGMARPRVKAEPFIGKQAYLAARSAAPAAALCTLTVDSHAVADETPRYMLGGEPILALDGSRLVDAHGRPSVVTSAGSGPSVGRHLLMSYLPTELSAVGTPLLVEYLGERYPVTVASQGAVFDPSGSRMR